MQDLQNILETINREGLEKASQESQRIIKEAQVKAAVIVNEARESAEKMKKESEQAAKDYAERAAETIRQSSRDIILGVKDAVDALLAKLLFENVDRSLTEGNVVSELVAQAVRELSGGGEILCSSRLAEAMRSQLAAKPGFAVIIDESVGNGFTVKTDNGRIEHSFTAETIAAELSRRLRPDLAKLVK